VHRYSVICFIYLTIFTLINGAVFAREKVSLNGFVAQSCPNETDYYPFSPLNIKVKSVSLGNESDVQAALPEGVSLFGAWELNANNSAFGGLSGLQFSSQGRLVAVSDRGNLITIDLTDGTPNGNGSISPLLDNSGKVLEGKNETDAEGLAYYDNLTFISFERNHRILAYALDACGAAARGITIAELPSIINDVTINDNDGAEALYFKEKGGLFAGYETSIDGKSIVLRIDISNGGSGYASKDSYSFQHGPTVHEDFKLVGASQNAYLFRAYSRWRGNRNIIRLDDGREIFLQHPLTVDNFEGIAQLDDASGNYMLYIISDDNFSARQKILLYAFKIALSG